MLFTTTIVSPMLTIGLFYANQDSIVEKHCENKDKPSLNCKGHCYLKKQLSSNKEKSSQQKSINLKSALFWSYAFEQLITIIVKSNPVNQTGLNIAYINNYVFLLSFNTLDPPEGRQFS